MKRNWSLNHFPAHTALGRASRLARWQAISLRWHRHGQAGITLVSCALLSALGRSLGLAHPAGLVTACAVAQCYCQVYLYLARRRCRRLFMRKGNDHAQGTDVTVVQRKRPLARALVIASRQRLRMRRRNSPPARSRGRAS